MSTFQRAGKNVGTIEQGVLIKNGVDDSKHLLWGNGRGGVPAIDAEMWDISKASITEIHIATVKGYHYRIQAELFDQVKETINHAGFGRQYTAAKNYWKISKPDPK